MFVRYGALPDQILAQLDTTVSRSIDIGDDMHFRALEILLLERGSPAVPPNLVRLEGSWNDHGCG